MWWLESDSSLESIDAHRRLVDASLVPSSRDISQLPKVDDYLQGLLAEKDSVQPLTSQCSDGSDNFQERLDELERQAEEKDRLLQVAEEKWAAQDLEVQSQYQTLHAELAAKTDSLEALEREYEADMQRLGKESCGLKESSQSLEARLQTTHQEVYLARRQWEQERCELAEQHAQELKELHGKLHQSLVQKAEADTEWASQKDRSETERKRHRRVELDLSKRAERTEAERRKQARQHERQVAQLLRTIARQHEKLADQRVATKTHENACRQTREELLRSQADTNALRKLVAEREDQACSRQSLLEQQAKSLEQCERQLSELRDHLRERESVWARATQANVEQLAANKSLSQQIVALKQRNASEQDAKQALESSLAEQRNQLKELTSQLQLAAQECASNKLTMEDLRQEIRDFEALQAGTLHEIQSLQSIVASGEQELARQQAGLQNLLLNRQSDSAVIQTLESELARHLEKLQGSDRSRQLTTVRSQHLESCLQRCVLELARARAELASVTAVHQSEVGIAAQRHSVLRAQLQSLTDAKDQLARRLAQSQQELVLVKRDRCESLDVATQVEGRLNARIRLEARMHASAQAIARKNLEDAKATIEAQQAFCAKLDRQRADLVEEKRAAEQQHLAIHGRLQVQLAELTSQANRHDEQHVQSQRALDDKDKQLEILASQMDAAESHFAEFQRESDSQIHDLEQTLEERALSLKEQQGRSEGQKREIGKLAEKLELHDRQHEEERLRLTLRVQQLTEQAEKLEAELRGLVAQLEKEQGRAAALQAELEEEREKSSLTLADVQSQHDRTSEQVRLDLSKVEALLQLESAGRRKAESAIMRAASKADQDTVVHLAKQQIEAERQVERLQRQLTATENLCKKIRKAKLRYTRLEQEIEVLQSELENARRHAA